MSRPHSAIRTWAACPEDALYGSERGDELPEHLRTREGRRQALREAKERLARERDQASEAAAEDEPPLTVELGPRQFVTRPQRRRRRCVKGVARWTPSARAARSPKTGLTGCLKGAGASSRNWTSSRPRMPPTT